LYKNHAILNKHLSVTIGQFLLLYTQI